MVFELALVGVYNVSLYDENEFVIENESQNAD
jgi:hypothetical protein